jgi:thymidylate synthase (FAD)
MVSACLEVETTRDIARQMLRHRSFSFQEFSQRYADPTKDLDFVVREARLQDTKNRQNSVNLDLSTDKDRQIAYQWENLQRDLINKTRDVYTWAIEKGIAKEQARAVLPEGLTVSRLYMNGTLRSWIHFIDLRSGNGTQKEHMEVARECAKVIAEVFPMVDDFVNK